MEFTDNFNANNGGFLVDPNSSDGYVRGRPRQRRRREHVYFARPSAASGTTTRSCSTRRRRPPARSCRTSTGCAVSVHQGPRAAPAPGTFANSTLYFMSRGGLDLFGGGDLDEVAVYDRALSASTIAASTTRRTGCRRSRDDSRECTQCLRRRPLAARSSGAKQRRGPRGPGDVRRDLRDGGRLRHPGGPVPQLVRHQRPHRRLLRRVRPLHDDRRLQPEPAADLGAADRRAGRAPDPARVRRGARPDRDLRC